MTTKPKRSALDAAFKRAEQVEAPATAAPKSPPSKQGGAGDRKDREHTVMIGGHFKPEVRQALRLLAAEENTTSQALLGEALNLLFVKKGKGKMV